MYGATLCERGVVGVVAESCVPSIYEIFFASFIFLAILMHTFFHDASHIKLSFVSSQLVILENSDKWSF